MCSATQKLIFILLIFLAFTIFFYSFLCFCFCKGGRRGEVNIRYVDKILDFFIYNHGRNYDAMRNADVKL